MTDKFPEAYNRFKKHWLSKRTIKNFAQAQNELSNWQKYEATRKQTRALAQEIRNDSDYSFPIAQREKRNITYMRNGKQVSYTRTIYRDIVTGRFMSRSDVEDF